MLRMFSKGIMFVVILLHGMAQSNAIQEIICEARSSTISCTDTPCSILNITYANYGRTSLEYCWDNNANNTNCRLANSTALVRELCQQKAICTLNVTHYIFDDPCPGFSKYLEVQFECITNEACSTTNMPSQTALSRTAPTTKSALSSISMTITNQTAASITSYSDTTASLSPSSYSLGLEVRSQSRSAYMTTTITNFATDKTVTMEVGKSLYSTMPSSKLSSVRMSSVSTTSQSALSGSTTDLGTTASMPNSGDFFDGSRHAAIVAGVVAVATKAELF